MIKPMKPKQPCKACLEKAWNALQMAQQLEGGLPCRSGAYWCNHRDVLVVYSSTDDGGIVCTITTGMTHDQARQMYTESVTEVGRAIDFVAPGTRKGCTEGRGADQGEGRVESLGLPRPERAP